MKPLHLVLALSLIANAGLAVVYLQHRGQAQPTAGTHAAAAPSPRVDPAVAARAAAAEAIAQAATKGDALALRDQLRALGLPDDVIRAAVRAVLYRPFAELQKKFREQRAASPYWKPAQGYFGLSQMTKEQRLQMRQANHDVSRKIEELLGPDPENPMVAMLSYLPAEKAARLRALEMDYNELRSEVYADQEGFRTPADAEKLAYLQREQRKDIEALLSPEELANYDLRTSSTASRVRGKLMNFDVTEDEYKALYAAEKALEDQAAAAPDPGRARMDTQQQFQDQLRTVLGEARYQEYLRSQNYEYRTLEAAARRFNLPQTTVDQVYNTRQQTLAAIQQITGDTSLTPEERTSALAAVANQTRAQVKSSLGAEVGDAYLNTGMQWLKIVEQGIPVTVGPDGSVRPTPRTPPVNRPIRMPGPQG